MGSEDGLISLIIFLEATLVFIFIKKNRTPTDVRREYKVRVTLKNLLICRQAEVNPVEIVKKEIQEYWLINLRKINSQQLGNGNIQIRIKLILISFKRFPPNSLIHIHRSRFIRLSIYLSHTHIYTFIRSLLP